MTVNASGVNYIDSLLSFASWTGNTGQAATVNYSFAATDQPANAVPAAMQAAFVAAMQAWANVANITFTASSFATSKLDLYRGDLSSLGSTTLGVTYTYTPSGSRLTLEKVIIDDRYGTAGSVAAGTEGFMVILHELGHALGLEHSGNYSQGEHAPHLPSSQDNIQNTIMSYYNGGLVTQSGNPPSTPMIYDIAAIQYLYGVNHSYHSGNDIYSFNGTATTQTIWDGAGSDTISASGVAAGVRIELREGISYYSQIGSALVWNAFGANIENGTGGNGNDTISGNALNNALIGGTGADNISCMEGNDTVTGDAGNDTIFGMEGNDYILGGTENDSITGDGQTGQATDGADLVIGDLGNDSIFGGGGADVLYGDGTSVSIGDGVDSVLGGEGNDTILGGGGNDTLGGDGGIDYVLGETGNDSILGGEGNDNLFGVQDADTIFGGNGNDIIYGDLPVPDGADGNDLIYGDAGNDMIFLAGGMDLAYGGDGSDTILGEAGSDTLVGDLGYTYGMGDFLCGGIGNDYFIGGGGDDTFYYAAADVGADVILDFTGAGVAGGDAIRVAVANMNGNGLMTTADLAAHVVYSGGNGYLDLGGGVTITLNGLVGVLNANDFIIG